MRLIYLYFFLGITLIGLSQKVSYIHKDIPLGEISSDLQWREFEGGINNGTDNGVYWFKIYFEEGVQDKIINLPESHIFDTELYLNGHRVDELNGQRYVTYKLPHTAFATTYYLKVNCHYEARIPVTVTSSLFYFNNELKQYIRIGLYCGVVLAILLFNLFSYLSFKNITYLHYMFMVLGVSGNAFYKDGLTGLIFGIHGFNQYLEPTINCIPPIAAIFFTSSYLMLGNQLSSLKKVGIFSVILTITMNVVFLCFPDNSLFFGVTVLNLLSTDIFWLIGAMLWKKSFNAKLFTLAYGVPLLIAHSYYVPPHFGWDIPSLPIWFYELGSVFEMVFFTYAIMYQAKTLATENKHIREQLVSYMDKIEELSNGIFVTKQIEEQFANRFKLTPKEMEVLKDISMKLSNPEIAKKHYISENTVKFHVRNIFNKLEVKSRNEAGQVFKDFDQAY